MRDREKVHVIPHQGKLYKMERVGLAERALNTDKSCVAIFKNLSIDNKLADVFQSYTSRLHTCRSVDRHCLFSFVHFHVNILFLSMWKILANCTAARFYFYRCVGETTKLASTTQQSRTNIFVESIDRWPLDTAKPEANVFPTYFYHRLFIFKYDFRWRECYSKKKTQHAASQLW